ncbi:MAG TPA: TadE/TadG family type IV pilus assembly protein [Ktedonobacterales bacterium]|nr:TadE/TadG family type IV pilus assembly protein [Ktedonobacterales bacterium]
METWEVESVKQPKLDKRRLQRGQALVEFAVIMSFTFLLLAGALDLGSLMDSHLAIVYATRQAARTGAEEDTNAGADCAVLGAVYAATQNLTLVTINRIVIYQADANGNPTSLEQVYAGNPGCPSPPSTPISPNPATWPPSIRVDTPPNEDSIGIEIDYTYRWQTAFVAAGNYQGTDRTVMKLNPVV